jgi:hypothetical protein
MSAQTALHLLRSSFRPLLEHVAQTVYPQYTQPYLEGFDNAILNTCSSKLGLPESLSKAELALIRLPIKMGGLGLPSNSERAPVLYATRALVHAEAILVHTAHEDHWSREVLADCILDDIPTFLGAF